MKFRQKAAILMVAILLSFFIFSLIGSSSACMLKVGKEAGYEIIGNYLAREGLLSNEYCHFN
jgi:hypothetical protein